MLPDTAEVLHNDFKGCPSRPTPRERFQNSFDLAFALLAVTVHAYLQVAHVRIELTLQD